MNNKKRPKNIQLSKNKNAPVRTSIRDYPIGWNFKFIELEDECYRFKPIHFLRYYDELITRYEGKTISEIERSTPHTHNWDSADKLDKTFQNIISKKHLEQEQIMQLSIDGKTRIWEFVRGNIFHFLCLDKDHSVYKTKLKNT